MIPVQPFVWAASDVVTLVSEARQFKPNLDAVFVINRKIVNAAIGRDVAGALADFNIPVSDHALHQRVVYAESAARGLGVIEAEPLARPAGARLAQSLLARMERAAA